MAPVAHPIHPAVADYPTAGPHAALIETAKALFLAELASNEGWEDHGEREGVQLYKKPDPENAYAVPTVKGETIVEGVTSEELLAVISLPGLRKKWDPRFENGHMLARYSQLSFAFYSEMKGMGYLVYPRDIAGVQTNIRSPELNQEILIIQTSAEEPELAPEQSGKTRATLTFSGWQLLPQGNDLKVTYVVKVALNGSMPMMLVNLIASETPLCTGRARDTYYEIGHAPYALLPKDPSAPAVIFQTETFSEPGAVAGDDGALEYRVTFTTVEGATFDVRYDTKRMYKGGVQVAVEGAGVEASDDGEGGVSVKCSRGGEIVTLVIGPE